METMATFRLSGESGGTAAHVTQRLGVTPTSSHEAGDVVGNGFSGRRHETSAWRLDSAEAAEDGVELATALHRVLDQLEPVAPALWELVAEGYWPNWFCYLGSSACEHAAELDRHTLQRLLTLPGDLWLDVYPDDEA